MSRAGMTIGILTATASALRDHPWGAGVALGILVFAVALDRHLSRRDVKRRANRRGGYIR